MKAGQGENIRQKLWARVGRLPKEPFEPLALDIFRYQAGYNPIYRDFLSYLNKSPSEISDYRDIPCLPISLFKTADLRTGTWMPQLYFSSSGTTGRTTSRHPVRELERYLANTVKGFEHFYGPVKDFALLALLPAYLERQGSSLVAMADHFIRQSGFRGSGFYLNQYEELVHQIKTLQQQGTRTLLLGVSFALLDLAERGPFSFPDLLVMETGGMKGRRKEIIRTELHQLIRDGLGVQEVHSEYGMTELFSQAYSIGEGVYRPAPTLRVWAREITDPFARQRTGKTGVLNLVDLANLDTISFIASDDLGRVQEQGQFEVLGRLDTSDIRGCNLLVQD